ncbi:hypothetical protein Aduo_008736 [Ancylostoma duodenale]
MNAFLFVEGIENYGDYDHKNGSAALRIVSCCDCSTSTSSKAGILRQRPFFHEEILVLGIHRFCGRDADKIHTDDLNPCEHSLKEDIARKYLNFHAKSLRADPYLESDVTYAELTER